MFVNKARSLFRTARNKYFPPKTITSSAWKSDQGTRYAYVFMKATRKPTTNGGYYYDMELVTEDKGYSVLGETQLNEKSTRSRVEFFTHQTTSRQLKMCPSAKKVLEHMQKYDADKKGAGAIRKSFVDHPETHHSKFTP